MIRLSFMFGRELMIFAVKNKEVFYKDRIWNDGIRCIPKDEQFIQKVRMSRNKYPNKLIEMFTLSKSQQEEYEKAATEEELAQIIITDCRSKGINLMGREDLENGNNA